MVVLLLLSMATKKRQMSDEHKAALAAGRNEGRAVARYLDALEANKPKRGRKRTTESIQKRLAQIEDELATAGAVKALNLRQERQNLTAELNASDEGTDLTELEAEFVRSAKGYGNRKGITYAVWREAGVPAATLKKAGISRAS